MFCNLMMKQQCPRWQRREGVGGTVKMITEPGLPVPRCGFAVPAGGGLGERRESGKKNGFNQSRLHQDKLSSSIPRGVPVTRVIS